MEYLNGGSLLNFIDKNNDISESFSKYTLWNITKGLKLMHDANVIHRDIKSDNIVVSADGLIKICDFGFAKRLEAGNNRLTAFPDLKKMIRSVAPECLEDQNYTNKIDTYSLGCIAYELATGCVLNERLYETFGGQLDQITFERDEGEVSDDFKDFIKRCIKENPEERPTMQQLLDHPFLQGAEGLKPYWV